MKRIFVAAALLLVMAALAAWHVFYLSQFTGELTHLLDQAGQQVEQERWSQAEALTRQALEIWEGKAAYLHTTMRHADIDAIQIAFQEVLAYLEGRERQPAEYAAANARLVTQLSLLLEAEQPSLKNLL